MKSEELDVRFSEKSRPQSEKCGPLRVIFCKKSGHLPEKCGTLQRFSDKKWTLT